MKNIVLLMNDFFRWGDIEAFVIINNEGIFDPVLKEIANSPEDRSLSRGKYILPKYKGSEDEKHAFYIELLKGLQLWSMCNPKGLKNTE